MAKQAKEAMSAAAKKQKALLDMLDSMGNLSQGSARSAAGTAGAGTMQQRNLEALLARLYPAGAAGVSAAAGPAASAATAPMSAEAAAAAMEGMQAANGGKARKLSLEAIFGKGKSALKTPLGKTAGVVGVAMLIDALVKGGLGLAGQIDQTLLQGQALDAQAAAMNPEATTERMMQPITKAQRDQAMMLLMRQLGVKGSSVADGEAWT